jgi:hypothetical protein
LITDQTNKQPEAESDEIVMGNDALFADLDELIMLIDEAVNFTSFTVKSKSADGLVVQQSGRYYKITIVPRATPKAAKKKEMLSD